MKAILGVDKHGTYLPALDLLAKLRFSRLDLTLLHVADPRIPLPEANAQLEARYSTVVQNQGLRAVEDAKGEACRRDLPARTKIVMGRPVDAILAEARDTASDLMVVCATHTGRRRASYLTSTTSNLAIHGGTSLLVAKGPVKGEKGLKVVLATDHSVDADIWLSDFIRFAPKGIKAIRVVSAYEVDDETSVAVSENLPKFGGDIERWLRERFEERNAETAAQLNAAGISSDSKVVEGRPNDVIRDQVSDFKADLLVIGSRGNLNLPESRIGSVALHQIAAEPYPVLLLRV